MNAPHTVKDNINSSNASIHIRHSIAITALRSSAIPIALAILATSLIAYFLFFASIKQQYLESLALFSKERVNYELEVFRLAENNLSMLRADALEKYRTTSAQEVDQYLEATTELRPDGSLKTRAEGFDPRSSTQIFVTSNTELSEQAKRTLAVTDKLISQYGLAWRNRFPNLYFVGKDYTTSAFWYGESFLIDLPGEFSHLDQPYFLAGTPENNPQRQNQWTAIYQDDSSGKLMVSSITPLYLDEQFMGVLGNDIYLDELMARTIDDHPESALNMLITQDGNLIAHPNYMEQLAEHGNSFHIPKLGDDNLKTAYHLVRESQTEQLYNVNKTSIVSITIEDKRFERYLVATQLGEMGWTLITEFPSSLIAKAAFDSAKTVLILGGLLLFVEFFVLFYVVRRKISAPLNQLGTAAHTWKSKRIQGLFVQFSNRKDELGSLSREFVDLQDTIDDQIAKLHSEIEVRKSAEQALTERSKQLSNLNENLDAMVKQRTAALEREVRERSLLTAAMEHAVEGILVMDCNLVIEYINPMFEKQSGFSKEDIIGKTPIELKLLNPELSAHKKILDALQQGEMWSGHLQTEYIPGEVHDEDATISPIKDENGKVTHFVEVKRNITERLELEEQLQSAQKLESIGQLAAGIAHEINTPTQYIGDNTRFLKEAYNDLNELINNLSSLPEGNVTTEKIQALMKEADAEYLQEEVPRAIEQSLEGVDRVATIVRAMKEFSHPSKEKATSDLNQAIKSTITVAANEWKYLAKMETDFDPELPPVCCELGEINQVVLNIIVNAAHAIADAKEGDELGTISISTKFANEFAEIRIADTGSGMPEAVKAKIFDPFFTTKEVGRGTGQGLSIAHKVIVKNHNGSISVESAPGEGTEFVIRLPVKSATETEADEGFMQSTGTG